MPANEEKHSEPRWCTLLAHANCISDLPSDSRKDMPPKDMSRFVEETNLTGTGIFVLYRSSWYYRSLELDPVRY
jgi:hypothetical protein